MKRTRTPQEKKTLSLRKDRRNTFGENDKASRKNIPKSKAISHRKVRHNAEQLVNSATRLDDGARELAESTVTKRQIQKGSWRKSPDMPLGEVLRHKRR